MSIRAYRDIHRRKSRQIMVGKVPVGGDAPITVQTMTNTITGDARATIDQIRGIEEAGADIVRVSCPDEDATKAMKAITKAPHIPVVADIHFHYKRAIEAAVNGAACLRINPGNIGNAQRVREVVQAAKDHGCSMRIGVNAGSLEQDLLEKYGEPCPEAMVESALNHAKILDDLRFPRIQDFGEGVRSVPGGGGLSGAGRSDRLPAASRHHRSRRHDLRHGEILHRHGHAAVERHRRHHPRFAVRRSGGRGAGRLRHPEVAQSAPSRRQHHFLPSPARVRASTSSTRSRPWKTGSSTSPRPMSLSIIGCVVNGPGEARETDLGFTGGGAGKGHGMIYLNGKPAYRLDNDNLVEHVVELCEKKAAEIEAARGKPSKPRSSDAASAPSRRAIRSGGRSRP